MQSRCRRLVAVPPRCLQTAAIVCEELEVDTLFVDNRCGLIVTALGAAARSALLKTACLPAARLAG